LNAQGTRGNPQVAFRKAEVLGLTVPNALPIAANEVIE
jgi:hypothetical protein